MLGDLQDLTADSLTDQNINSRVCRNWPVKGGLTKGNDLEVLGNLTHFLSDNRVMLKKVVTGGVELGTIGSMIIGKIEIADKILNDFTGWLRDHLYSKLWDSDADAAPAASPMMLMLRSSSTGLPMKVPAALLKTAAILCSAPNLRLFFPLLKISPARQI